MTSITMIKVPVNLTSSKMDYSEPETAKQLAQAVVNVYLNYDSKQALSRLLLKLRVVPIVVLIYMMLETTLNTLLMLTPPDMDNNDKLREFYDMMEAIDEQMVEDAVKNSMAWFKKRKQSKEVVKALYSPLVKLSRDRETGEPDGKYPPTFRVKLPYRDGNFTFEAFDDNTRRQNSISWDVRKMAWQRCSIFVALSTHRISDTPGGKFGTTWRAEQVKINPPKGLAGYSSQTTLMMKKEVVMKKKFLMTVILMENLE